MSNTSRSFQVLFEDQHLIVLAKPAGLLSQGEHTGDENLVDLLRDYFGRNYVGLVHRLDRNTSGCMVVAKRTKAARRLSEALRKGELKRLYQGWVSGVLRGENEWCHWLLKDEQKNVMSVVDSKRAGAKKAVMSAKAMRQTAWHGKDFTLVEFVLDTGRSHQIRVQAAAEGHALLGDIKYGAAADKKINHAFGRPALHASSIRFPHPMSGEVMEFQAELPKEMLLDN